MCVTGVLLTYEQQMIRWAERGYRSQAPGTARLPLETLVASATEAAGAPPSSITIRADRAAPVEAAVGAPGGLVVLDAYTGELLGEGAQGGERRDGTQRLPRPAGARGGCGW